MRCLSECLARAQRSKGKHNKTISFLVEAKIMGTKKYFKIFSKEIFSTGRSKVEKLKDSLKLETNPSQFLFLSICL